MCFSNGSVQNTHENRGEKQRREEENGWEFNGKWLSRMKQQSRVRPEPDTQNSPRIEWEITFYGIVVVFIDPLDIVLYSTFCIFFFCENDSGTETQSEEKSQRQSTAPKLSPEWVAGEKQRKFVAEYFHNSKEFGVESTAERKKCWFFPLPLLRVLEEWMEVWVGVKFGWPECGWK